MKVCLCSTKVLFGELFYHIMPYQQNEKSTQIYQGKSWMGSLKRVVKMGKEGIQAVQLQEPSDIYFKMY